MLSADGRRVFDGLLEDVLATLPEQLHVLMEEVPLIVEDEPSAALVEEMGIEPGEDLCGLHWGIALTHRSVEHSATLPDRMMLFRGPILRVAGWRGLRGGPGGREALREQIRITLLHEIGHHFGLDEDDLERLGYG